MAKSGDGRENNTAEECYRFFHIEGFGVFKKIDRIRSRATATR
jgi:hypothetical protein